jgi:hypothetical protein
VSFLPELVYILCAITALSCTLLLLRAWLAQRVRLLLWSAVCFLGLTIENVLLFVDMIILPEIDLAMLRNAIALAGLMCLVLALILNRSSA